MGEMGWKWLEKGKAHSWSWAVFLINEKEQGGKGRRVGQSLPSEREEHLTFTLSFLQFHSFNPAMSSLSLLILLLSIIALSTAFDKNLLKKAKFDVSHKVRPIHHSRHYRIPLIISIPSQEEFWDSKDQLINSTIIESMKNWVFHSIFPLSMPMQSNRRIRAPPINSCTNIPPFLSQSL